MALPEDNGLIARNCAFGKGLFTTRAFATGDQIAVVRGRLVREPNPEREEFYMDYGSAGLLEPYAPYRYLNHSCEPNCELQIEEFDDDLPEISIVALRKISPGEQLSNDYGWPPADPVPCFCGASTCRDWIVSPEDLPKVRRKPLPMKRFPAEFAELLNARGRRLLAAQPQAVDVIRFRGATVFPSLLSKKAAASVTRLLSARCRDPLQARSLDNGRRVHVADLNGRRSRANQLAAVSGLTRMLGSRSLHRLAEVCSGQTLMPGPSVQLQYLEQLCSDEDWLQHPAGSRKDRSLTEVRIVLGGERVPGGGAVVVVDTDEVQKSQQEPSVTSALGGACWTFVLSFQPT